MDPLMPVWQLALVALVRSAARSLLVWAVSVVRRNVALADRFWSVLIMVSAVVFALGLPPLRHPVGAMLLLGAAWAHEAGRRQRRHARTRRCVGGHRADR